MYVDAWQKSRAGEILSPLDVQIAAIVSEHPEYQTMLQHDAVQTDSTPTAGQSNPFLHMGLHLAIREQVATNRPSGIAAIHQRLGQVSGGPHQAEHQMIECLAASLWDAQSRNLPPDEQAYLECLQRI